MLASVIVVLLSASCSDKDNSKLIPEKTLSAILTEVHLADGLLTVYEVRNKFAGRDTASNYIDIIESHGYSKEQMERTLRYYFTRKPKRLIKIYDQAMGKLSKIESLLANNPDIIPVTKANFWPGESSYFLPDTLKNKNLHFHHKFTVPGLYTMEFTATVYPDDQSCNPHFTAWTCNADSAETGKRNYLSAIRYLKDGHSRNYLINFKVQKDTPVLLKGYFYTSGDNPDYGDYHARFANISISYIPDML